MTRADGHPKELHFAVLAADVALFTIKDGVLHVRLVRVNRPPHYVDTKGLAGGLLLPTETAEEAIKRLIKDKASVNPSHVHLEQLYTFSDIKRDLRGRVVAVAYNAFIAWDKLTEKEQAHTENAWWEPVSKARGLAYDHDAMLAMAYTRLRSRIHYTTLIAKLLPDEITLTELEEAYETVLGSKLDKRNFRKKILKLDILTELDKKRVGGRYRPAQLYRFTTKAVTDIEVL